MGSKTLLKQNPPVLNWGCRPMQVVMYNGDKTSAPAAAGVVVVVVLAVVVAVALIF